MANFRIGTVLVSKDGFYLSNDGALPVRHIWDKTYITNMARGKTILASVNTAANLPKSITNVAKAITVNPNDDWDVNFGISTFKEDMNIFIICKSTENLYEGRVFNMDIIHEKYNLLLSLDEIDIWILK